MHGVAAAHHRYGSWWSVGHEMIAELAVFPQVNSAGESCMHSVIRSGSAAVK